MAAAKASQLFPNPSLAPSSTSPHILPGVNPTSTKTLKSVLEDNHKKHHIFFNEKRFHNHIAHRALAVWALGADGDIIQAGYETDSSYQRPAFESPEPITRDNFNEHLGDERFYDAYLKFFTSQLDQKSVSDILEEFVFASAVNFGSKSNAGKHPEMLNRFLDGLVHPLIHTGYGVEFSIPGLVAEGLAETAVHLASSSAVLPPAAFTSDPVPSVGSLTSRLHSFAFRTKETADGKSSSPHAFTTLARFLADETIKPVREEEQDMYATALEQSGDAIYKHVSEWATFDPSDPEVVKRKVEELQWTNALLYAVSGFQAADDKSFKADFFMMHLVTSSLFLPSLIALLSPSSQLVLLRGYFASCLGWYVSRGKASLDIEAFFAADTSHPELEAPGKPSPNALISSSNPNPWLAIINQAINHKDDHLPKIQRALGHYSTLYGSRTAGGDEFSSTELKGADKIDGTLFIRAAGLTTKRVGGDHGPDDRDWDF
ncbi:hypothetical protein V5O48_005347 [Marasmius crinis-equi]|uniref:Oxidoreductase AflY n=1 Tax=Marasmius crinis-equi TaxID=585013 RepID=A0ABR3FNI4_9AGAR